MLDNRPPRQPAARPSAAARGAPPIDRRGLGERGESLAAAHLERLGYRVVARNERTRHGEIDLIVTDGRALVFVEVKTRLEGSGPPLESLGPRKGRRVRRLAMRWLSETTDRPTAALLRLDAVGVVVDSNGRLVSLEHLEDAF
jgi:putative endonuclease